MRIGKAERSRGQIEGSTNFDHRFGDYLFPRNRALHPWGGQWRDGRAIGSASDCGYFEEIVIKTPAGLDAASVFYVVEYERMRALDGET